MSMARAENGPPHLAFDRVEVYYSALVAGLKGVSLSVNRGEFVFLCGQTGSGKSTLLKLITREVRETSGKVSLLGRDLGELPDREIPYLRRQMGIVPQDYGLLPNKKVWENVAYAMRAVDRSKREVRQRVPQILEQVNIMHRADAFPGELSGGEQQRVAIARALINDPPLLIADEPTGNLDPTHSAEIMALLSRLNEQGTTIIVATHDIPIVQRLQQRVIELEFGAIVGDTAAGDTWSPNISAAEYTTFEEKESEWATEGDDFEIYLDEPQPEPVAEVSDTDEEETPLA